MAISVRTRFDVFKRDEFTCGYCGRKSPDVVLEVDHIVPVALGGRDDEINLLTSCWECNRGKSAVPLSEVLTGEDPHDKAIAILEKRRQLDEYNNVLAEEYDRIEAETWNLIEFWNTEKGITGPAAQKFNKVQYRGLKALVKWCPREKIREFMELALLRGADKDLRYVYACCRNWRVERMAEKDIQKLNAGEPID